MFKGEKKVERKKTNKNLQKIHPAAPNKGSFWQSQGTGVTRFHCPQERQFHLLYADKHWARRMACRKPRTCWKANWRMAAKTNISTRPWRHRCQNQELNSGEQTQVLLRGRLFRHKFNPRSQAALCSKGQLRLMTQWQGMGLVNSQYSPLGQRDAASIKLKTRKWMFLTGYCRKGPLR